MAYPDWLLGRDLTTITVTPGNITAGAFAPGTVKSFFTTVDEIEFTIGSRTNDIRPITQFHENQWPVSRGNGFRLREILRKTAAPAGESGNALADMFHSFPFFLVVFTRAARTFTMMFSNGGYTELPGAEKGTGAATFLPIAEEAAAGQTWTTGSNAVQTGAGI